MKRVVVCSSPESPVIPTAIKTAFVDMEDGRGWCAEDGTPVDPQQDIIAEVCYLHGSPDQDSKERSQLLYDLWFLSKRLTTESLRFLMTTAIAIRGET